MFNLISISIKFIYSLIYSIGYLFTHFFPIYTFKGNINSHDKIHYNLTCICNKILDCIALYKCIYKFCDSFA